MTKAPGAKALPGVLVRMGASEGLGYLLIDGQQMGKPDQIVAAIIAFALLGKVADSLLIAATGPLVRWQDPSRRAL